jgi:threonine dehydrogenase-like Zn-dependent dehydrogenase
VRAVACHQRELSVVDLPDPEPGPGQLLLDVSRCGICGSDLHARVHGDDVAALMGELDYADFMRSGESVVFGHEFCGEVVDTGPGCRGTAPVGTPVVSFPLLRRPDGVHPTGLTAKAPGAYAEQVLVEESLSFAVPNGLPPEVSVLTEPLAVGWHAVRRSEIGKRDTAIVIGCGPIGLAVICLLKARGVERIVASDLSAGRRALATRCGAHVVVDPTLESPYAQTEGFLMTAPDVLGLAVDSMEKLRRVPRDGWRHVYRAAETLGKADPPAPVVFECVGVPGMIDGVIGGAPLRSRVVVVGVCMDRDAIRPAMAINKEIDLRFVLAYTPLEYRDTLHMLADGKVDASPLVTGTVGLDGVATAFEALGAADKHAKILIDPKSAATAP